MKVYQGPYINWIGPYQIAEKLCFWAKKEQDEFGFPSNPDWVHNFGTWLSENKNGNDSWLMKVCKWYFDRRKRKMKIRIDNYDCWEADKTLAFVILPLLKQVKEKKQGSPFVDDSDVPEELRSTTSPAKENEDDVDANFHKRWDWVLDEMIWAFEQLQPDNDWEQQYCSGEIDIGCVPIEYDDKGNPSLFKLVKGTNYTYKVDHEGMKKHAERITRGTTLFGKYFRNLST